ncbi:MAG: iron-sulfur cluster assembly scaffold protein [Sphingomicrobium sp.]
MNAPLYTTEILRLAASLAEPRRLTREDGRAEVRSPTCGSRVSMAVQLDPDGRVEALSQLVLACAFGQASAALLERGAAGRNRDEANLALSQLGDWLDGAEQAPDWPGIAALTPAYSRKSRHGAILLPFRALLAAIESAR